MLSQYEPIKVIRQIDQKYGHTQPLVLSAVNKTTKEVEVVVVKCFEKDQVENRHVVVSEVIGHALASTFDFFTPSAGLIELSEEFLICCPLEIQNFVSRKDIKSKFCTKEIRSAQPLQPQNIANQRNKIELETLWAFDVLIRNSDRNQGKPNLLATSQDVWLIDHERALDTLPEKVTFDIEDWPERIWKHHVAYNYVKRHFAKRKLAFDTFEEHLRLFNPVSLEPYLQQLQREGYQANYSKIFSYFNQIQSQQANFVSLLKRMLQ
jgi:hypothetical protein